MLNIEESLFYSGVLELLPLAIVIISIIISMNKYSDSDSDKKSTKVLKVTRLVLYTIVFLIVFLIAKWAGFETILYILVPTSIISTILILVINGFSRMTRKKSIAEDVVELIFITTIVIFSAIMIALPMMTESSMAVATIPTSVMSGQEIEAFNSRFLSYEGTITGTKVKALIGRLIANAKTYYDSQERLIPRIVFDDLNDKLMTECLDAGELSQYVYVCNEISASIDSKKAYNIKFSYSSDGIINEITITPTPGKNNIIASNDEDDENSSESDEDDDFSMSSDELFYCDKVTSNYDGTYTFEGTIYEPYEISTSEFKEMLEQDTVTLEENNLSSRLTYNECIIRKNDDEYLPYELVSAQDSEHFCYIKGNDEDGYELELGTEYSTVWKKTSKQRKIIFSDGDYYLDIESLGYSDNMTKDELEEKIEAIYDSKDNRFEKLEGKYLRLNKSVSTVTERSNKLSLKYKNKFK